MNYSKILKSFGFSLLLLIGATAFAQIPCSTSPSVTPNYGFNIPTQGTQNYVPLLNANWSCLDSYLAGTFLFNSIQLSTVSGPILNVSTDSCCTGFFEMSTGLELENSLWVNNGSVIIGTNNLFLEQFNNGFGMFTQAGPRTGGGVSSLLASTTFTYPDLAEGGTTAAAGVILAISGTQGSTSAGHCLVSVWGTSAAGVMHDSGFGCNVTKRVAGCTTAATQFATCSTTVTWNTPFADTNYTVSCTGDLPTSGAPIIQGMDGTGTKSGTSITVQTAALTAVAANFTTINCIAVHD
jgi:hypothetical protein